MNAIRLAIRQWWTQLRELALPWASSLLPGASIALFLWWFCSVPIYQPAPLPSGWTPGCAEWEIQWHEESVPPLGRITWHLVSDPNGMSEDVLILERGLSGSRLYRYDPATGERLQASDPLPHLGTTMWSKTSMLCRDFITSGTNPSIYWLDPESLAVQRQISLQLTTLMGAVVPRLMVRILMEHPTQELTGIVGVEIGNSWHYYWAHFSPDGKVVAHQPLSIAEALVVAWPLTDPQVALTYPLPQPSALETLDLSTGRVVPPPSELPVDALTLRDWELPLSPVRRGWNSTQHKSTYSPSHARVIEQGSHPYVFGHHDGAHSNHPAELLSRFFAELRRAVWKSLWSDQYLADRANRSYRLEQLILRGSITDPAPRLLAGDLLESAQAQPLVDSRMQPGRPPPGRMVLPELDAGVDVHPLPGRSLLISQTLTRFPAGITDAPAIWRLGLLPAEATAVQWLGWMPLPTSPTNHQRPRIDVRPDRLVIYVPGLFYQPRHGPPYNSPFRWTTVPLPPELANGPERPLP